jgi:hypothetical protein
VKDISWTSHTEEESSTSSFLATVNFTATAMRALNPVEHTSILTYTNFGDWKSSTLKIELVRSTETFITIFTSDKATIDKIIVNKFSVDVSHPP